MKNLLLMWHTSRRNMRAGHLFRACVATSRPGAIHLLTGLYSVKADTVIVKTGNAFHEMICSKYPQDVALVKLFSDFAVYNNMINSPVA